MKLKAHHQLSEHIENQVFFTYEGPKANQFKVFCEERLIYNMIYPLYVAGDYGTENFEVFTLHQEGRFKRISFLHFLFKEDKKIEASDFRKASHALVNKIRATKHLEINLIVGEEMEKLFSLPLKEMVKGLGEGFFLSSYSFNKYQKEEKKRKKINKVTFITKEKEIKKVVLETELVCQTVSSVRDWVNEPSNHFNVKEFSKTVIDEAKKNKVAYQVMGKSEIKKLKMGGLLAVNAGSSQPAQILTLEHGLTKYKTNKKILLVGKGVVFDTGGISLKPSLGMGEMKMDMAGGACVLGTVMAAKKLDLNVSLIGMVPMTDNKPGSLAINPGDVVKMHNGVSVEIDNTDAEGRLILADTLAYGIKKYKPNIVIDVATLTGACIIALGNHRAGLFSNEVSLAEELLKASMMAGEKLWELPLDEEYFEQIKSDVADIRNVGGREAGAVTAAKFLERFVDKVSWAHLDIAGTAFLEKPFFYWRKGATGFGVRLLIEYLKKLS